ncbi:hypothetical protein ACTOJ1_000501 [Shigella flexneri]
MKNNKKIQKISIKNNMLIINDIEYDHQGNILENDDCAYVEEIEIIPGTIINYDGEFILFLEDDGFIVLDYGKEPRYEPKGYDWLNDPRTTDVIQPFQNTEEMMDWLKDYPYYKDNVIKYYKTILK